MTHIADYISNLCIYLQVLQLLRKAPLTVRYTICQQVLSMLYNTPHHVNDIALSHGWESLFLWQLTHYQETLPAASPAISFKSDDLEPEILNEKSREISKQKNGSSYQRIDAKSQLSPTKLPLVEEQVEREVTQPRSEGKTGDGGSTDGRTVNQNGVSVSVVGGTNEKNSCLVIAGDEEMSGGRYRSRSSALVDSRTKSEQPVIISDKLGVMGVMEAINRRPKAKKRGSLTYSKCWDDTVEKESDEMSRTCNIVTETIAYILWRSTDNHTDRPPWKVCVSTSLSRCVPVFLYTLLIACSLHCPVLIKHGLASLPNTYLCCTS